MDLLNKIKRLYAHQFNELHIHSLLIDHRMSYDKYVDTVMIEIHNSIIYLISRRKEIIIYINFNSEYLKHYEPENLDHKKVLQDVAKKLEEEGIEESWNDEVNEYTDGSTEIVKRFCISVSEKDHKELRIEFTMPF